MIRREVRQPDQFNSPTTDLYSITELFIKQKQLYGHPEVPDFETSCRHRATAYAMIHPLKPNIRHYIKGHTQITIDSRLDGAAAPYFEFLVA